jgi:hypothetical protein
MHIEPQGNGWWMGLRYIDVWVAQADGDRVTTDCRGCAAEFGMRILGRNCLLRHRRTWWVGFLPGICLVFETGGSTVPAAEVIGHSPRCLVQEICADEERG